MARDFSEGRAAVRDGAGHWGFIDKKGRVVVELKFADVTDFSEGLAGIDPLQIRPGLTGFVDRDGRIVIKPQFYVAYQFSCGLARVFDRPEIGMRPINTRFIRHDGSVAFLVDQSYTLTSEFHDGLAVIRKNDKYGYLNTKGKIAVQAIYDDADSMREGLAAVKVGDLWGFIDNSGKRCIKPTFIGKHDAPAFSEGYAFVTTSSGWRGFINKNGKQVLADTMGRDYGMFKNGLVVFSKATPTNKVKNIYQYEFGYMKQDGEVVFIKTFLATGLN